MYSCHTHFYLTGYHGRAFEIIKEMEPLEHFTHVFAESDSPDRALCSCADVIFADLQGMDAVEAVRTLVQDKRGEAELIVFADLKQREALAGEMPVLKDIWAAPMTDEEVRFHFLRWQQTYKMSKDFWETSQYLDATINHVPNLIWYKDKNGIHEKVNDSFCQTVNKTKEQVQGRGHAYIWDVEKDDPACIESERQVMTKKQTFTSEEIIQTGEGERTLTTYKSPLYDIDGSVMGTVGVAIDVTQEREYEDEIIKKNRALETVFASIDCGVICHSLDGTKILRVNKTALKMLECETREELLKKGFDMIAASVMEEDKQRLQRRISELKEVGDSRSIEYRVRHKNGDVLHIMGNIKLLEENGEMFYQRFLLDCTEQKLQEQKNARHQMELVQALSTDYSLVCFFNLDSGKGAALRNSDYDGGLFGTIFSGEIMLNKSMELYIQQFVHEEDKEMFRRASEADKIREELDEKKTYVIKYRIVRDGVTEYFEMKAVRTGVREGQYGVVLGFHSIDEATRKEMEKKAVLEEALLQANRASKAKSVFLSNMSHDIRTPMNAIVGFTSLALSHMERQEQVKEYLEKIMTSGNHLLSLINDVLDMSRIESGKIRLEEKPCSLPEIVHGLCNILQADVRAKQLGLYVDAVDIYDEDIYCDKLRLNQVLLNVISNSVKYTKPGGSIHIRIQEEDAGKDGYARYVFRVRDTGIGMSKEFLEHMFDPFEREENSTISGIQGTGLGMAITKNIVDMMHGEIEVQSEQGVGTEFKIAFLFRLCTQEQKKWDISELKGCRALVVDHDENNCESIARILGQIGMQADWMLPGEMVQERVREAAVQKNPYRVCVIGWMLPEIDGIEIAYKIKEEVRDQEERIMLLLCADDWADSEEKARAAGITAFCSRPLFISELTRCLHTVLHGEEEKVEKEQQKKARFQGARILLAEDVDLNQEIAVELLGDAGFQTEVADNGQIAVEMLQKSEPGYYKLILMDIQMPVMNGYEATKAIRGLENRELASIPIIAMSANAFEEDKREAMECGMNGHIAKPIDVDAMFDTLNDVLS